MQKHCSECHQPFTIDEVDVAFYEKISPLFGEERFSIPTPNSCPACRLQRRLSYRNQIYVYSQLSALSAKPIFSMFAKTVPFPVIENDLWWGDSWDALQYGRDFNPQRSLFEQLCALRDLVPHYALSAFQLENSDYCNNAGRLRNCYLVFNSTDAQDCSYCENTFSSVDCIDCTRCPESQLCYTCVECPRCYNLQDSEFCEDCVDSYFLSNCRSCRNCFGCVNLRHQEYCIDNQRYSAAQYAEQISRLALNSSRQRTLLRQKLRYQAERQPVPHLVQRLTENVRGNFLFECRNIRDSYFVRKAENLRYCFNLDAGVKDSYDYSFFGRQCELLYQCVDCGLDSYALLFCFGCWQSCSNLLYCVRCTGCEHCFACVGLKKKRYCILNRQYTREEYERLAGVIIKQMQHTGEWGEYFPASFSPIPYNHSIAQRYFPLTKEAVEQRGLVWLEHDCSDVAGALDPSQIPDILPTSDASLVLKSELSGRPFRVTSREMATYRRFGAPLPRRTYDERMEERAVRLGGIHLYPRNSAHSGKEMLTTYSPTSTQVVWEQGEYESQVGG